MKMTVRKELTSGVANVEVNTPYTGQSFAWGGPPALDISRTGYCQLRCDFCWGPEHNLRPTDDIEPWKRLLVDAARYAADRGKKPPIALLTGGEPLLDPKVIQVLEAARENGLPTWMSTNAIATERFEEVLPLLDGVGIPIDGSTAEINNAMRARSDRLNGLERAISGILLAQLADKPVPVTVRTVVTHKNKNDIPNIPRMLSRRGVDITNIRHKLYQLTPVGPLVNKARSSDSLSPWNNPVSIDDTMRVAVRTLDANPGLTLGVQLYPLTANRYLQVRPNGSAYTVRINVQDKFKPYEVELGNVFDGYERVMTNYSHQVYRQPPVLVYDVLAGSKVNNDTVSRLARLVCQYRTGGDDDWAGSDQEAAFRWLHRKSGQASFEPGVEVEFTYDERLPAADRPKDAYDIPERLFLGGARGFLDHLGEP